MSQTLAPKLPTITDMIREDLAKVTATFHGYDTDATPEMKVKLVTTVGLALETQARLQEEILYPALRAAGADESVLAKAEAAHHQMHSLIGQLRDMRPTATHYDDTVQTLKDVFIRRMVDEEAELLPQAERLLQHQLSKLGVKMHARRLVLNGPSLRQVGLALAAVGGVALGIYLATKRVTSASGGPRSRPAGR